MLAYWLLIRTQRLARDGWVMAPLPYELHLEMGHGHATPWMSWQESTGISVLVTRLFNQSELTIILFFILLFD